MKAKYLKHPEAGKIVQGTYSKCCNTSVSFHFDTKKQMRICTCNHCKQETEPVKKDTWTITDEGKYRPINK